MDKNGLYQNEQLLIIERHTLKNEKDRRKYLQTAHLRKSLQPKYLKNSQNPNNKKTNYTEKCVKYLNKYFTKEDK